MSDSTEDISSWTKSDVTNIVTSKNAPKRCSITSGSTSFVRHPLRPIILSKDWKIGKGSAGQAASFLIKTLALETMRRFSKARCPFLWTGLQALQVLCYPPFKWLQFWSPFGFVIKGMQMLSRPLLVLSIATAISNCSDCSNFILDDTENSQNTSDLQAEPQIESPSEESTYSTRTGDQNPQSHWLCHVYKELENQGITLPERIKEDDLQRFYIAANGDLSSLLLSIKKTIRWRETYRILSGGELEMWSNMVFWHGLDVKHRPCLIIRLGMTSTSLSSHDRPRFVQAVVSQVEHGVLHLVDGKNPQITVLLDCHGLSPLRFPMQMLRYCCNLLQDNFPNLLGCLFIIRLPPVVRVIAQTFIQVLKPATKEKLRIEGEMYLKALSECFQTLPSYLGGQCTCTRCANPRMESVQQSFDVEPDTTESAADIRTTEGLLSLPPSYPDDILVDGNNCMQVLRTAVIGILIFWVLITFLGGLYDPESRQILPP
ncbi:SEC14 cytosolic factor family protein/phosphoglyceride transfer family protein [Forsythia ovata]|uniref:SEC14 cytosolic factor family protein/phosphoglyceride transfer family protein n=1 Tax=Forsythia ovata TaxID=205694 RepID=A0ABD1W796_9LAMI